jgi:type VI secretion system protein VasD
MKLLFPKIILMAITFFLLTGCMLQPGVNLEVKAVKYLNPSLSGEASPIVLTVYELKTPLIFQKTDYKLLMTNSDKILNSDLLDKTSFEIRPTTNLSIAKKINPKTYFLGMIAAYRKPLGGGWRAVVKVDKSGLLAKTIIINLKSHDMSITQ